MKNYKEIKHLAEEAKKKEQEEKRFCKLCQNQRPEKNVPMVKRHGIVSLFQFNPSKERKLN